MKRFIYIPLFVLLVSSFAFSQTEESQAEKSVCPKVQITSPSSAVNPGETVTFTVNVFKELNEKYPIIDWSLDKGSIISGQGTSAIGVSTSGLNLETLTVKVKVDTDENCSSTLFGTVETIGGDPILLDEFGKLETKEIKRRFDVLLKELNNSQTNGYIVNYGAKAEVEEREKLFRTLIKENNLPDKRIEFLWGGEEKEIITRFWLVPYECPSITLTGPPSMDAGDTITFTLDIRGKYDPDKIKIDWTANGGNIFGGQGTMSLKVLTYKKYTDGMLITATAKVSGFPEGCSDLEISETGFCSHCGTIGTKPILFDEFGNLTDGNTKARLDAFIIELQNNEGSQGYIINYGSPRQVARRERVIRNYLNYRSYDMARIVFVNGGVEKEIRTRLWRVPPGADASEID